MTRPERLALAVTFVVVGSGLILGGNWAGFPLQLCGLWLISDYGRAKL